MTPSTQLTTDAAVDYVLAAEGAYTTQVAEVFGVPTARAYSVLQRAAAAGRLFRGSGLGDAETFWMDPEESNGL